MIKIFFLIAGIFLILDAGISIMCRQEDKVLDKKKAMMYQPGRYIRGIIGIILVFMGIL